MRPSTACYECRRRRRKCLIDAPGLPCKGCQSRSQSCSLAPENVLAPQPTPGASTSSLGASPFDLLGGHLISAIEIPTGPLCQTLVSYYFQYIHDPSHSLFHRPSFDEDLQLDLIPQSWLLAIIGLSARFSKDQYFDGTDPRTRGRPYVREAERLVDLHDVSLTTVRALLLLGAFFGTEGDATRENLYYSTACRIGLLLDIPSLPVENALDGEMNVRLWWTLEMVDLWSSSGTQLPRAFASRDNVPYPIEESLFLRMRREDIGLEMPLGADPAASLTTQMLKLNAILSEIAPMNRTVASQQTNFNFDATVNTLTRKLDSWVAQLPPQLLDTPQNLASYASIGLGGMFVALYLGYYHYGQLLYYQYLHHHALDEDLHASYCADMCRSHSISLCNIIYRAYETKGAEVYYTMVGHVLVIASTVQLHILLFSSDDAQVRAARQRLERNFNILTQLQKLWPAVDNSFGRFTEFHKACEESKGSNAFRLDKWMLQFLLEFTRPVRGQREEIPPDIRDWSRQELGLSPTTSIASLHFRTMSM